MTQPFEGLEPAEVTAIIEWTAAMCSEEEIKKKFFDFTYPGKTLTGKQIQTVSLRFAKQIRERNAIYLKNIKGNPLAHQRIRLDILNRIVDDALKQRPSHSVKISPEEFEIVKKADNPTAIAAIKLAMQDLYKREEMDRENQELESEEEDERDDYEVDDGMDKKA